MHDVIMMCENMIFWLRILLYTLVIRCKMYSSVLCFSTHWRKFVAECTDLLTLGLVVCNLYHSQYFALDL